MGKVIEAYRNLRTLIAMRKRKRAEKTYEALVRNHEEAEKIYEVFEVLSEDREWVERMRRKWGDEIAEFGKFSAAFVYLGLFYYPKK